MCLKRCPSPQAIAAAIKKIRNIKASLKPGPKGDISGVTTEMQGVRLPKPHQQGRYWDHVNEWKEKMDGLRKRIETLKKCDTPEAKQAVQEAEALLKQLEDSMKGIGI